MAIENLGWFSKVEVGIDKGKKEVIIQVEEYPVIKSIVIKGSNILRDEEIINSLGIQINEVFNKTNLYGNLKNLYELYQSRGYTQVDIEKFELKRDGKLEIHILEWQVKELIIENKCKTRKKILADYLLPKERSTYNSFLQKKLIEDLYYTNAFKNIDLTVERSEERGFLILKANVVERGPDINLKLQYQNFGGFNGEIKLVDPNFLGRLEEFSLNYHFYFFNETKAQFINSYWNTCLNRKNDGFLKISFSGNSWRNKRLPVSFGEENFDLSNIEFLISARKGFNRLIFSEAGFRGVFWNIQKKDMISESLPDFFLIPYMNFEFKKEDPLKRSGHEAKIEAEFIRGDKDNSGIRFSGSLYNYYFIRNIKVFFRASAGIISTENLPILYKFWIGNDENLHYLKYEELMLNKYALFNLKIDFPYFVKLIKPSFFSDLIFPDSLRVKVIYGLQLKITNFPLYFNLSFSKEKGIKDPVFSLFLRLQ